MGAIPQAIESLASAIRNLGVPIPVSRVIIQIVLNNADPAKVAQQQTPNPSWPPSKIARRLHRESLKLQEIVGNGLVSDPVMNMLLILYADAEDNRDNTIKSLTSVSGSPPTTALRYLSAMEESGMVVRHDNPHDRRSSLISPTRATMEMLREATLRLCAPDSHLDSEKTMLHWSIDRNGHEVTVRTPWRPSMR